MSHRQKTSYNDLLAEHIRNVQAAHPELTSFSATVRYLVAMGIALEYERQAAADTHRYVTLTPAKEFIRP